MRAGAARHAGLLHEHLIAFVDLLGTADGLYDAVGHRRPNGVFRGRHDAGLTLEHLQFQGDLIHWMELAPLPAKVDTDVATCLRGESTVAVSFAGRSHLDVAALAVKVLRDARAGRREVGDRPFDVECAPDLRVVSNARKHPSARRTEAAAEWFRSRHWQPVDELVVLRDRVGQIAAKLTHEALPFARESEAVRHVLVVAEQGLKVKFDGEVYRTMPAGPHRLLLLLARNEKARRARGTVVTIPSKGRVEGVGSCQPAVWLNRLKNLGGAFATIASLILSPDGDNQSYRFDADQIHADVVETL